MRTPRQRFSLSFDGRTDLLRSMEAECQRVPGLRVLRSELDRFLGIGQSQFGLAAGFAQQGGQRDALFGQVAFELEANVGNRKSSEVLFDASNAVL